jgi:hypothetical protein
VKAFVELREAWFDRVLRLRPPHDGRCYDPDEADREHKAQFDQQTIGIILGKDYAVAPTCPNDLSKGEKR